MKFSELNAGDDARILGFRRCDKMYRQRLFAMGLTVGCVFKVLRKAPLGDPFHIEIRGTSLSLRKAEADLLDIEKINNTQVA